MQLKEQLKELYEPSNLKRRNLFLMQFDFPKISYFQFVVGQISFIRKRIWWASSLCIILAILGGTTYGMDQCLDRIWIFSSILPFILLISFTEILRSVTYSMNDLEQSCIYRLEHVMLARLFILGSFNVCLVFLLSFILKGNMGLLRIGLYLSVPSLLSCLISLIVVNYVRSGEVVYICAVICVGVSLLNMLISLRYEHIFMVMYTGYFMVLAISLIAGSVWMGQKLLKRMEQLEWNLVSMV